jgi:hypothetical protein
MNSNGSCHRSRRQSVYGEEPASARRLATALSQRSRRITPAFPSRRLATLSSSEILEGWRSTPRVGSMFPICTITRCD